MKPLSPLRSTCRLAGAALAVLLGLYAGPARGQNPGPSSPLPSTDVQGNPLRRAATGHVSNYDEAKVGTNTLPDPLKLANGQPVRDAATWFQQRRPEIIKLYEDNIYGRVPVTAPRVTFTATPVGALELAGQARRQQVVGRFGGADGPTMTIAMFLPAKATGPVPLVLSLSFNAAPPPGGGAGTEPVADILARGYGYAIVRYTEMEGDKADTNLTGVRQLALAPGQTAPGPGEWGTISAWAWGVSRIMDYLATDPGVDAKRVVLVGHSRLGKTVLWAGAQDPRFALVFSSCAGEMGSSLARRDYGETVDDMAANFPWQFTSSFQKYAGHWNDLPVDTHLIIALNAPHPLLITAGTQDQWADPRGEFLAEVAAGPVYRLVGKKDLGTDEFPAPETPVTTGELAFLYHTGKHAILPSDWKVLLDFADAHLRPAR